MIVSLYMHTRYCMVYVNEDLVFFGEGETVGWWIVCGSRAVAIWAIEFHVVEGFPCPEFISAPLGVSNLRSLRSILLMRMGDGPITRPNKELFFLSSCSDIDFVFIDVLF